MRTIAVTGATGFVGRALVVELVRRGHRVVALSRRPEAAGFGAGVVPRRFDPNVDEPQPEAFAGVDAVVHVAGESVAGRWTPAKKRAIAASRIEGTRALVRSLAACAATPAVLVSASASGYYGSRGDEVLDESAQAGTDFLASVCAAWEREARAASSLGVRVAMLRTGIVLGRNGGALAQMLPVFRRGLGGPFGSGRQFVPWIHLDDLVALYVFAIENERIDGPVNAVAPDYATSARFAQALGAAVRRPALLPAPRFALRLALGEFGDTLVGSQLMIPAAAEDAGFSWRHDTLEEALHAVAGPPNRATRAPRRYETEQIVPGTLEEVFDFFAEARNLEAITPPALRLAITSEPASLHRGASIDYRLALRGFPMRWKTLIARWDPPRRFVDVQLHGPYALWRHEHTFTAVDGGVLIGDRVRYALPLRPLSAPVAPLVDRDVRAIFAYRRAWVARHFASVARDRIPRP